MAERIAVTPSQSSQSSMKYRLRCAERGQSILQRKLDGLLHRSRSILLDLLRRREDLEERLSEAAISLAEATFLGGNLNNVILESVGTRARVRIERKTELIGGERIDGFVCVEEGVDAFEFAGLASGRRQLIRITERSKPQLLKVQSNYRGVLADLVKIASALSGLLSLESVINRSRRRVNALRHLVIPRLNRTLGYLAAELEEKEREELYRLKKFQARRKNYLKRNFTREPRKEASTDFVLDIFYEDDDLLF